MSQMMIRISDSDPKLYFNVFLIVDSLLDRRLATHNL